jgi:DNA-binding NarL/FixJ family response regulator
MLEVAGKTFRPIEKNAAPFKRILVVVAPPGSISEYFLPAVEREFPWISIEQVESVEAACVDFRHPVSLILVDATFLAIVDALSASIAERHPGSLTAVMYDDCPGQDQVVDEILRLKAVRSVLPMNLRLDIWLSVIRLMMRGGEYFPSSFFRKRPAETPAARPEAPRGDPDQTFRVAESVNRMLNHLTEREIQVLEMVSHGCQNKLIAAKFNLSEHTIKVHLHNIIKKLGAGNRTAAAAMFLERAGSANGSANPTVPTLSGR